MVGLVNGEKRVLVEGWSVRWLMAGCDGKVTDFTVELWKHPFGHDESRVLKQQTKKGGHTIKNGRFKIENSSAPD